MLGRSAGLLARGLTRRMGKPTSRKFMIWLLVLSSTSTTGVIIMIAVIMAATMMMPGSSILQACAPSNTTGGSGVVQANAKTTPGDIPRNYAKWYDSVGAEWNIPKNVLAGIGWVETHHGTARGADGNLMPGIAAGTENYAGAGGPMQFLQSSWQIYGADGDGDGKKDRYNPADAIAGAANHLRGSIGKNSKTDKMTALTPDEIKRAVHRYNPGNYTPDNNPYVRDVLAAANYYAKDFNVTAANFSGSCSGGGVYLGSGTFGQLIANAAAYWARKDPDTPRPPSQNSTPTPYSWGGGSVNGPTVGTAQGANTVGFDCSSLAQYAVYKASKGEVTIPRTTYAIWSSKMGVKVSRNQLVPGDLVFFNNQQHMGIYYGEVDGVRWMVHAPHTGDYVKFSKFDGRSDYDGAVRITAPTPPKVIRAMAQTRAGTGAI